MAGVVSKPEINEVIAWAAAAGASIKFLTWCLFSRVSLPVRCTGIGLVPPIIPPGGMIESSFRWPSAVVAPLFEPIVQRSVGSFPEGAFKATLAAQAEKITCPRAGNDKPCRLDLAVLDDF